MEKEKLKIVLENLNKLSPKNFLGASEKIRRKIKSGKAFSSLKEKDFYLIRESVLDPVNKTRCKEVFDSKDRILPETKKFILDVIKDFKDSLDFDFNIRSIWMIGSSTGYQYSLTSDIDIALITDIEKKKLGSIINKIPKGIMLPNTQKPLNVFLTFKGEDYDKNKAENVFDVENEIWLKKTEKNNIKIPYAYILGLSRFFMNGCDLAISEYERNKHEFKEYERLDPENQEITEKEKAEAIDKKILDLKNAIDNIKMAHHVIFSFEKEGYEGWPFRINIETPNKKDPRYSVNNMVYKMIDRFGYLEKLIEKEKEGKEILKNVKIKGRKKDEQE